MWRVFFFGICGTTLLNCATSRPSTQVSEREIPERYRWIYDGVVDDETLADVVASLPFERIELERKGCYGSCPVYKVQFERKLIEPGSGYFRATYVGIDYVELIGTYSGAVYLFDYGRLCYLIEQVGLVGQSRTYEANRTHQATEVLRLTIAGTGAVVEVSDYGSVAPIHIWAIRETIDAIAAKAAWRPVEEAL